MFFPVVVVILMLIIALGIVTLIIVVNLRSDGMAALRKLPGYKPHLLYGNALEMHGEAIRWLVLNQIYTELVVDKL